MARTGNHRRQVQRSLWPLWRLPLRTAMLLIQAPAAPGLGALVNDSHPVFNIAIENYHVPADQQHLSINDKRDIFHSYVK